jgi:O-acetyl-ADP-ribose deacetylase (regulator of RNase III)
MAFLIANEDITKMRVDAIVNAANNSLLGGGGVDGAIHRAAGPKLLEECRTLNGCRTGEAKYTKGYELPAKYVIHTVGPIWQGGGCGEEALLYSCYANSLAIADELGCESVAFPLISSGVYGYPKREAKEVAERAIRDFLETHDMTVYLTIFGRREDVLERRLLLELGGLFTPSEYAKYDAELNAKAEPAHEKKPRAKLFGDVFAKLSDRKAAKNSLASLRDECEAEAYEAPCERPSAYETEEACSAPCAKPTAFEDADFCGAALAESAQDAAYGHDISTLIRNMDESFSQNLLRRIDASGMTDAECYKRANVDRKLFSKIRSDVNYRPSKQTAIAFCVALRLDLENTEDLLRRAGFALSRSSKFDVILTYFITRGRYDVYEINDALFAYDQPLLGA